jgi:hypothetical protein
MAARAGDFNRRRSLLRHNAILRPLPHACKGARWWIAAVDWRTAVLGVNLT